MKYVANIRKHTKNTTEMSSDNDIARYLLFQMKTIAAYTCRQSGIYFKLICFLNQATTKESLFHPLSFFLTPKMTYFLEQLTSGQKVYRKQKQQKYNYFISLKMVDSGFFKN